MYGADAAQQTSTPQTKTSAPVVQPPAHAPPAAIACCACELHSKRTRPAVHCTCACEQQQQKGVGLQRVTHSVLNTERTNAAFVVTTTPTCASPVLLWCWRRPDRCTGGCRHLQGVMMKVSVLCLCTLLRRRAAFTKRTRSDLCCECRSDVWVCLQHRALIGCCSVG